MANTGQSDKMNVDTKQVTQPKMKSQTSGTSTGGTMHQTDAMAARMAQLQAGAYQRKGKKMKKKSFDGTSLPRTTSQMNRERYFSLATKGEAKKIIADNQRKKNLIKQQKNKQMKQYIKQSQRNVFAGMDDKKEDDGDAAMLLKDKKLAKVDDDGDTQINTESITPKDTAMKDKPQKSEPTQTAKKSAKSQQNKSKPQRRIGKPILNPCVPKEDYERKRESKSNKETLDDSKIDSGNNAASNGAQKKRHSGIFGKFFKKKDLDSEDTDSNEPQRLTYQLPNSKGEKFELYTWLKPTKLLGEGAYAAVCEILDQRTNKKYAVKKNRDVFSNVADARRILREIKLMTHLDHPHVMSLCGVVPPEAHDRDTYKDCYLIMPKMDTTLSKVIRSKQKLSERHIQYFIYQIARGLEYMHSGGIIHRDLKPENILVNATDCKVKITDFGLSRGVSVDVDSPMKLTEYVVTRWYRAPEVMCCSRLYDYQIDTWALGCISAELYTRRPVFKGRNHIEQLQLIFHFMGTPKDLQWITTADAKKWIAGMPTKKAQDLNKVLPNSTKMAQAFIKQLLLINPHERPDITTALKHPWMKEFAREKDYRKCPVFNISFEYESSIKTAFGVRHMMYEELHKYHRACVKRESERMERYRDQVQAQQ